MAEYFMPAPGDGYIKKTYDALRTGKRYRPSFPRAVQFQTLSTCNAKCVFCPHSSHPGEIPHGRMDDALIKKIIDESARHLVGRISPYLTNEPLLDKRMPDILSYIASKKMFFTKTKINTNGALLTSDMAEALIDSKLSQLWISVNGYTPEAYRSSMGLDLDRTLTNIDNFLALKAKKKSKRPKVVVTTLKTQIVQDQLDYARKYWEGRDVVFKIHSVDNRSGTDLGNLRPKDAKTTVRSCDLFLKQAYIVENGDMILCCHDWRQSVKLGNVAETSIREVWNSAHFKDLIHEYMRGDFTNLAICRTCC